MRTFLTRLGRFLDERSELVCGIGIALLLLVGLVYSVVLGDELRYQDERDYLQLARNLVEHGEYSLVLGQPTAGRAPGYPLLLAVFVGIGIPVAGLRMVNFLLLAAAVFLLSMIARRQRQRVAAAVIPFIVLGYPLLAYTAGTFFPQTLAGFLLCAHLFALTHAPRSAAHTVLCGIALGLTLLTAPIYLLLLPALLAWSIGTRHQLLRASLVACILATAITTPWLARNYVTFKTFPLFGTNVGSVLLAGNSEHTTASSGHQVDLTQYGQQVSTMNELDQDKFYTRSAFDHIRDNPGRTAVLYFHKFLNWFSVTPNLATPNEATPFRIILLAVSYVVLISSAATRLWRARQEPLSVTETIVVIFYLTAAMGYAFFFTKIRFRVPFDLLLTYLAASTVELLRTRRL